MVDMTKSLTCTICSREKLKASMIFISLIGRITPYSVKLSSWLLLVEGMKSNVRHSVRGRCSLLHNLTGLDHKLHLVKMFLKR